jgi:hypothetical protein
MRAAGTRELRRDAEALLRAPDFEDRLADWHRFPARRVLRPLFALLSSAEDLVRWRAVRAMGLVATRLADEDLESGRVVMRRLMWSLADESGGIGWGAPEAMGEIMANHEGLAREFAHVLVSYVRGDEVRLDEGPLLRGAIWGLGRLGEARPRLLEGCLPHLEPFLRSGDPALRGLATWALARMGGALPPARARALLEDEAEFSLYADGALATRRIRDVAALAFRRS